MSHHDINTSTAEPQHRSTQRQVDVIPGHHPAVAVQTVAAPAPMVAPPKS